MHRVSRRDAVSISSQEYVTVIVADIGNINDSHTPITLTENIAQCLRSKVVYYETRLMAWVISCSATEWDGILPRSRDYQ